MYNIDCVDAGIVTTSFNKDIDNERLYFLISIGSVITTMILISIIYIYFEIKDNIEKIKDYD